MKKFAYFSLIIIIIGLGIYLYKMSRLTNEGSRFASDERELENFIFQKDSTGRGYSDIVKEKIESEFGTNDILSNQLKNKAKEYRQLLRSKNSKEFIENQKKTLIRSHCIAYLLDKQGIFSEKFSIAKEIVYDNKKMKEYYEYLSLVRFGQEKNIKELVDWMNSWEIDVETDKDYKAKCLN